MKSTVPLTLEFEKSLLQINQMKAAEIFEKCYASIDKTNKRVLKN